MSIHPPVPGPPYSGYHPSTIPANGVGGPAVCNWPSASPVVNQLLDGTLLASVAMSGSLKRVGPWRCTMSVVSKAKNLATYVWNGPVFGRCPICETRAVFVKRGPWLRDQFQCFKCKSIPRNRALIHILQTRFPNWRELRIHESSPGGPLSNKLSSECRQYRARRPRSQIASNAETASLCIRIRTRISGCGLGRALLDCRYDNQRPRAQSWTGRQMGRRTRDCAP
jgi:hypothetical protein